MFCEQYLKHFNGSLAARESGCSPQSAAAQACYFLSAFPVKEYLKKRSAEIMAQINEEQIRVFRELCNLAFSDIRELYQADGKLKPMDEWPDETAKAVSSIKQTVKGKGKEKTLEVKLWSKPSALENLAKCVGLLRPELNVLIPNESGSIYYPLEKEIGEPVDERIIARDAKFQLIHGEKTDHDKQKGGK